MIDAAADGAGDVLAEDIRLPPDGVAYLDGGVAKPADNEVSLLDKID